MGVGALERRGERCGKKKSNTCPLLIPFPSFALVVKDVECRAAKMMRMTNV